MPRAHTSSAHLSPRCPPPPLSAARRRGNPLLDISADVGQDLLDKYGLKLNNAILAEAAHLPLYAELVAKYPVQYIAGGATQNSIRVAQWMHGGAGFAAYAGCVGSDAFGEQLRAAATADGVAVHYDVAPGAVPTGTCAVLVHATERSLVANLAAAEKYSKERHFDSAAFQAVVARADTIYSAGFFLTHAVETAKACGAAQVAAGKSFALNLAAPFLCQFFGAQLAAVLPLADLVFGNESEAAAYAAANGLGEGASVEATARAIAALPHAGGRARTVIITQGSASTVAVTSGGGAALVVPVAPIDGAIVDTNGAGDAFVGGFLAWRAKGADLEAAIKAGHWAAGHVITRSGCTFERSLRYTPA